VVEEEELLLLLLQQLPEVLGDLVVVEEQILVQQVLEIPHQYHHHKEILVELDNLVGKVLEVVVVDLVAPVELQLLLAHNLLPEMVDLDLHLLFLVLL
jgi:hypothetical protein